jgi:hypothetical protein
MLTEIEMVGLWAWRWGVVAEASDKAGEGTMQVAVG